MRSKVIKSASVFCTLHYYTHATPPEENMFKGSNIYIYGLFAFILGQHMGKRETLGEEKMEHREYNIY